MYHCFMGKYLKDILATEAPIYYLIPQKLDTSFHSIKFVTILRSRGLF